jgi:hypothetical protein
MASAGDPDADIIEALADAVVGRLDSAVAALEAQYE